MTGPVIASQAQVVAGVASSLNALLNAYDAGVLVVDAGLSADQRAEISRELQCMRIQLDAHAACAGVAPGAGSHHLMRTTADYGVHA